MTREEVYDKKISPLMTQIIALCKGHDIPMVASFQYNDDRPDGDAALCTTVILSQDNACEALSSAAKALRRESKVTMLTVRDATGNITRMEAIVT